MEWIPMDFHGMINECQWNGMLNDEWNGMINDDSHHGI